MSKVRMLMGHVAGISLTLLLAGTTVLEAQGVKPRPTKPGKAVPQATGQAVTSSSQVATTQLASGVMLPCCVLEKIEQPTTKEVKPGRPTRILVVKNTKTGELHRKSIPAKGGKYRPGQQVHMNIQKTAIAITPFPVEEYKRKEIKGNSSWVMRTWVTVTDDGRIKGRTKTKTSEAARGFTGGVEVLLTDRAGKVLYQTDLRTYGVNGTAMGGKSEQDKTWSETAPVDAINKVRAIVIYHSHQPKVRFAAAADWIRDNYKLVYKVYKCGAEYLSEDGEQTTASAPPPPPPGQPSGSQSIVEGEDCLESAQELAQELGY